MARWDESMNPLRKEEMPRFFLITFGYFALLFGPRVLDWYLGNIGSFKNAVLIGCVLGLSIVILFKFANKGRASAGVEFFVFGDGLNFKARIFLNLIAIVAINLLFVEWLVPFAVNLGTTDSKYEFSYLVGMMIVFIIFWVFDLMRFYSQAKPDHNKQ